MIPKTDRHRPDLDDCGERVVRCCACDCILFGRRAEVGICLDCEDADERRAYDDVGHDEEDQP